MRNCRMLIIVSHFLLCCFVSLVVGCSEDYTGDLLPERNQGDGTPDLLSEDDLDTMMSLPPLPYAPPPDLTDSDSGWRNEAPRQPEHLD